MNFISFDLIEFSIKQRMNTSNVVLSNEINFKDTNGSYLIDFSPEIESINDVRESDIYFSAKDIHYEILPYAE